MIPSWFELISLKNQQFPQKSSFFSYVFDSFSLLSPFFMPKGKLLLSLFTQSLFLKERWERFAIVAFKKRATMRDSLFFMSESLFRSFVYKYERFAQKTWANSQPWVLVSAESDSSQCWSSRSQTLRSVSQRGVTYSRLSPSKTIFQQNHLSLLIRGPGGFDSWKNAQQNLVTLPL